VANIFSDIVAGLTKAENFLITIFQKEKQVSDEFASFAPATKAAILATFYDVAKTAASVTAVAGDAAAGNFTGAITLSTQTIALVQGVIADAKNDASVIKTDLQTLGILPTTPAA
jgi:hypothetical protein